MIGRERDWLVTRGESLRREEEEKHGKGRKGKYMDE